MSTTQKTRVQVALLALLGAATVGRTQVIQFPTGSVVITAATVSPPGSNGRPTQLTDTQGRSVVASFDDAGRLIGLKVGNQRNMRDLTVSYHRNGNLRTLVFGNGYQVTFHYLSDGSEVVTDNIGNRLIRIQSAPTQYVTQSATDKSGQLAATLNATETLFALIEPTPGLNVAQVRAQ